MKRVSTIAFLLATILFFQCSRKSDFNQPSSQPVSPDPISAKLNGNVFDENGAPAQGVTVKVGAQTAVTDVFGSFRFNNAALDKKSALVTAELNGYFKAYRTFAATAGTNFVAIKLTRKTLIGTINAASGGSVSLSNGAKISLPANGVVKASDNNTYAGVVNVYAAYIDPTSTDIYQTVPGSFMADDKNGGRVVLASYGMMDVELESSSAEKLQIRTGSVASLTSPIPASLRSTAPASIPLWYVNEQTGIWKEEGQATRSGEVYVGDVKHFTPWNVDIPVNSVLFSVKIRAGIHNIVHAYVELERINAPGTFGGWTDSLGQVSGYIPKNEILVLRIKDPCLNTVYTQNVGPFTQNTDLGTISVNTPNVYLAIGGHVSNCSGANVVNGYAIINYNNLTRYTPVDVSGNFSTNFLVCSAAPGTAQVLAVDNGGQQQSNLTTVNVTVPATNVGNITTCGNPSAEYINYTVDGNNYAITSYNGDPLNSYQGFNQGMLQTNFSGIHDNTSLSLSFNHSTQAPGTYPIVNLILTGVSHTNVLVSPSNVVVTNFPLVIGQFYQGTFYGTYTYSTGTHTITGSFKVRKNS